jgi:hypothetical protein
MPNSGGRIMLATSDTTMASTTMAIVSHPDLSAIVEALHVHRDPRPDED